MKTLSNKAIQNITKKLNELFEQIIESEKIQCASYRLVQSGVCLTENAMGPHRYNSDEPFRLDSVRWTQSTTKMFTAVVIMQLVEKGKLEVHQKVSDFLPQFERKDLKEIEIFHLLTHTSELRADPGYFEDDDSDEEEYWAMFEKENWLDEYLSLKPYCPIGTEWIYSSANYAILSEIIVKVTGKRFAEVAEKGILKPLEMNSSSICTIPKESYDHLCFTSQDEEELYHHFIGKEVPIDASGGLESTLEDLTKFSEMLLNGGERNGVRILSEESVKQIVTNQLENVFGEFWGANYKDVQFGLGGKVHMDGILPEGSFEYTGSGGTYCVCDPVNDIALTWFVPMNLDYVEEAHVGVMKLVWDEIKRSNDD